ncbi:MFS general substrate transporter [Meredithblackwellia eburnea MCA 4105]
MTSTLRDNTEMTAEHPRSDLSLAEKGPPSAADEQIEDVLHAGVTRIEALYHVFGNGWKIWMLYISVAMVCYGFSLQQNTTYTYLAFATSSMGHHSLLGAITTTTTVISGVARPFLAKLADTTSRPNTYLFSLTLYVLGFILLASAKEVNTIAAGQVIFTLGATGVDLVNNIIIGDITPLQWRGFCLAVSASPFIINGFIAGFITDAIGGAGSWRWGFGMFCIILPVCMAPALTVLFWADVKAKKLGALSIASPSDQFSTGKHPEQQNSLVQLWLYYFEIMDAVGLILLGFSWSLILLPFTLASGAVDGWKNASMIAMEVVGWVLFVVFLVYETRFCAHPLMPRRVLNRTFVTVVASDILYFIAGNLQLTFYSSWIYVLKDWNFRDYTFFINCLTISSCVFGLLAGVCQRYFHNYKWFLFIGLGINALGLGIVYFGASHSSDGVLIASQLLLGLGGGYITIASATAAQGSVPHADLATAISLLGLWSSLGASIGSAIATSVWTNKMPQALTTYLSGVISPDEILTIFGSITDARYSTPEVRALVLQAYKHVVKNFLFLPALIVSVVPVFLALTTSNYYLGASQNAVETDKVITLGDGGGSDEMEKRERKVQTPSQ